MPTVASKVDLGAIAKGCGYPNVISVDSFDELDKALLAVKERNLLSLIEVKCSIGAREDLGRPTTGARENKVSFMKYLIGIDIGTSGTKTVKFDVDGNVIKSKTVEYPISQPQNGWAEQNPELWVKAVFETLEYVGLDNVVGIGLSGQMHGLVMLDENNEVIRPAILWCEQPVPG